MLNRIVANPVTRTDMLSNIYCLYGEVNVEEAKEITEWILYNNYLPETEKPEVLTLIVNSDGGDLFAAWTIIDMMKGSGIPVHTIGTGMIASAGVFIVMSGENGYRTLSESCSIMSHQFSAGSGADKYHELKAVQKEYEYTHERLVKHIKKCTGLTKRVINKELMSASDIWLTAEEAIELNLADNIQFLK
jgi:ATP-dependent protease ClpP protease subunit